MISKTGGTSSRIALKPNGTAGSDEGAASMKTVTIVTGGLAAVVGRVSGGVSSVRFWNSESV